MKKTAECIIVETHHLDTIAFNKTTIDFYVQNMGAVVGVKLVWLDNTCLLFFFKMWKL
jgi:hypothetical protein